MCSMLSVRWNSHPVAPSIPGGAALSWEKSGHGGPAAAWVASSMRLCTSSMSMFARKCLDVKSMHPGSTSHDSVRSTLSLIRRRGPPKQSRCHRRRTGVQPGQSRKRPCTTCLSYLARVLFNGRLQNRTTLGRAVPISCLLCRPCPSSLSPCCPCLCPCFAKVGVKLGVGFSGKVGVGVVGVAPPANCPQDAGTGGQLGGGVGGHVGVVGVHVCQVEGEEEPLQDCQGEFCSRCDNVALCPAATTWADILWICPHSAARSLFLFVVSS